MGSIMVTLCRTVGAPEAQRDAHMLTGARDDMAEYLMETAEWGRVCAAMSVRRGLWLVVLDDGRWWTGSSGLMQ